MGLLLAIPCLVMQRHRFFRPHPIYVPSPPLMAAALVRQAAVSSYVVEAVIMSRFAFRRTAVLLVAVVTALSLWLAGTASAQGPDGRVNGQPWVNSWGGVAVYCNASNSGFAPGLN